MPKAAQSRIGEVKELRELLTDSLCHESAGEFRVLIKVLRQLPRAREVLELLIPEDLHDDWSRLIENGDTSVLQRQGLPPDLAKEVAGNPASIGMAANRAGLSQFEVLAIMRAGARYNKRIGLDGTLALLVLEKAAKEGKPLPHYVMLPVLRTIHGACEEGGVAGFNTILHLFESRDEAGDEGGPFGDKHLWMWHTLDYMLSYERDEYSAKDIEDSFPPNLATRPSRARIVDFCVRWGCACRST